MSIKGILKELLYRIRGEYTTEKLIKLGLRVGKNFKRLHGVILDPAHCFLITIGEEYTMRNKNLTKEQKEEMYKALENQMGFII